MKTLGTTAFLYGDMLEAVRSFGFADDKRQFRVICRCHGIKDANEKCMNAGLGSRIFVPEYTNETGNKEEVTMCLQEDIWIAKGGASTAKGYVSVSELTKIAGSLDSGQE